MANEIKKIKVGTIDYSIIDEGAARLEDLPVGEVNLTLTSTSISDGTTTLTVPDASGFVTTDTEQIIRGQKTFTNTTIFNIGAVTHTIDYEGIHIDSEKVALTESRLKLGDDFNIWTSGMISTNSGDNQFVFPTKPMGRFTIATTDDITTAIGNAIAASY